jgi:outer membrane protein W
MLLCFSSSILAQQNASDIELGGNIGFNSTTVSNSSYSNSAYKTGLNLGVSADYYFSDRWSVKAKLIYDQKGWKDDYYSVNLNLNYVTLPVMANWHFGRTRNWYLNFGPYAGFLISASSEGMNVKSSFNSTDFGLALGIGVKIPISDNLKIFIEDDGQAGFTNILKSNSNTNGAKILNSRSGLNVGLNFILQ